MRTRTALLLAAWLFIGYAGVKLLAPERAGDRRAAPSFAMESAPAMSAGPDEAMLADESMAYEALAEDSTADGSWGEQAWGEEEWGAEEREEMAPGASVASEAAGAGASDDEAFGEWDLEIPEVDRMTGSQLGTSEPLFAAAPAASAAPMAMASPPAGDEDGPAPMASGGSGLFSKLKSAQGAVADKFEEAAASAAESPTRVAKALSQATESLSRKRSFARRSEPEPLSDTAIDDALDALPIADIAFNTPEEIPLGETAMIELLLSMTESEEELAAGVSGPGPVESARVKVSNEMEARLSGLGFEIEPITPESQAVSRRDRTQWRWQIRPTQADAQPLHLTLSAQVRVDRDSLTRTIKTFERKIVVHVPIATRVMSIASDYGELLFTLLLAPLGAAVWRRWKKKSKDPPEDPPSVPMRRNEAMQETVRMAA
ncbi:hypothetical protein Mal64_37560 [Pseudobythopirellula maris]|uniref:Uncharacterized protein n=1 Tax=Pseudobythopirellula maris TaxID=2527991 RepID=A0A5C5ZI67_9BACT|nr:hypothetical protein [Pseudobythopirellula maris]TWT86926.1 hypothetical protein Mal64_37560 [Pseudobythopirellula maris]